MANLKKVKSEVINVSEEVNGNCVTNNISDINVSTNSSKLLSSSLLENVNSANEGTVLLDRQRLVGSSIYGLRASLNDDVSNYDILHIYYTCYDCDNVISVTNPRVNNIIELHDMAYRDSTNRLYLSSAVMWVGGDTVVDIDYFNIAINNNGASSNIYGLGSSPCNFHIYKIIGFKTGQVLSPIAR